ncbi:hypothetical protein DPMN_167958 [Dreissena polymorpha]|uniref:Uncharacterized protein n=1 Tax=Dreissena polymorpha TaxID=45954 RepID=A0A9D4IWT4_DREPO|nr:hypothetical protein DPMN_167958 [Dreissena polymorpha]
MSLVQGISRFSYVYEGLTPFAVYIVDYIAGFAGDLVPHIVAFAGGVADLSASIMYGQIAHLCAPQGPLLLGTRKNIRLCFL